MPPQFRDKSCFILKLTTSSFILLGHHRSKPQPLPKNSSFQRNLGPTSNPQWRPRKDEEIHDSEISETHEAEGSKAHKPDETIGNIVQPILFFFLFQ